ncbi:hypothetical protein HY448_01885 [Candidatus Pacearchaeota archaeon]|nr:hypothetical protein [Candidatus Pacearchaeota archaeon]
MGLIDFLPISVNLSRETPIVCFNFSQGLRSHLNFILVNNSKVEVEVKGKIRLRVNNVIFQNRTGFYGDKNRWVLQPLMKYNGNLDLRDLVNNEGTKLKDFVNEHKPPFAEFNFQIKYRKTWSWVCKFWRKHPFRNLSIILKKN